jgi:hypothetical protein
LINEQLHTGGYMMLNQPLSQALNLKEAKAAAETPVRLLLMRAGAPIGTDMKNRGTRQLICSGFEDVSHLRRDCRKERPDKTV